MPCNSCGYSPCQCTPQYAYNWFNTSNYPCNPCSTTTVCKKTIPGKCTIYGGPNLTGLGLTTGMSVDVVLAAISVIIAEQTVTNANILTALNDINDRINVIDSGSHAPYVI